MSEKKSALDASLGYLTHRMRSEKELRDYLARKEYSADDIEQALERLKDYGYVDDAQFAQEMVRSQTHMRPTGRFKLRQKLKRSGVGDEALEQALSSYSEQDEQQACNAQCQKLAARHGTSRPALAKIQRSLLSKGFGYDMIRNSIQQLPTEDEWVQD